MLPAASILVRIDADGEKPFILDLNSLAFAIYHGDGDLEIWFKRGGSVNIKGKNALGLWESLKRLAVPEVAEPY